MYVSNAYGMLYAYRRHSSDTLMSQLLADFITKHTSLSIFVVIETAANLYCEKEVIYMLVLMSFAISKLYFHNVFCT